MVCSKKCSTFFEKPKRTEFASYDLTSIFSFFIFWNSHFMLSMDECACVFVCLCVYLCNSDKSDYFVKRFRSRWLIYFLATVGVYLQSLLGKMKCSVSKILPTTISKWLSPNVDTQNNRRRRYDELDSEEDDTYRNQPTAHGNVPVLQRAATTGAIAPPTKRQRIITVSFPSIYLESLSRCASNNWFGIFINL